MSNTTASVDDVAESEQQDKRQSDASVHLTVTSGTLYTYLTIAYLIVGIHNDTISSL